MDEGPTQELLDELDRQYEAITGLSLDRVMLGHSSGVDHRYAQSILWEMMMARNRAKQLGNWGTAPTTDGKAM